MHNVIEIKVREVGKTEKFVSPENMDLKPGDFCIIEQDRGLEYGVVVSDPIPLTDEQAKHP
ncbi:MAG: stage 0 sporulation protein, partial [Candidatus Omnitrophota bacterium]